MFKDWTALAERAVRALESIATSLATLVARESDRQATIEAMDHDG